MDSKHYSDPNADIRPEDKAWSLLEEAGFDVGSISELLNADEGTVHSRIVHYEELLRQSTEAGNDDGVPAYYQLSTIVEALQLLYESKREHKK